MSSESEEPKIYTYLSKIGLSKEKIYTFLDKAGFKDIIGENLGSTILNKINDFEIKIPTEDEITDFIYDNLEYVKRIFVFQTSREDVYNVVHRNYEFISNLVTNVSNNLDLSGFESLKTVATLIRKGMVYLIEIGIAICVILLIVFRASLYKWFMWIHAVTLPVGLLFLAIGTLGNKLIFSIVTRLKFLFLVEPFVSYFTNSMVRYGIILLIISGLSLLIHTVIKIIKKKRKKEDKETEKKLEEALN